jgi:hypothetical protein
VPTGGAERRHEARIVLPIPLRAHGYEADGEVWEEVAAVEDVTSQGVCFALERVVDVGRVLRLDLALPRTLRDFDRLAPTYRVYAVVRHVIRTPEGCRIGALFLGKNPPRGFESHPAGLFLMPDEMPDDTPTPTADRPRPVMDLSPSPSDPTGSRSEERLPILVNLIVRQTGRRGVVLQEELTVSDNLSLGGAEIRTALELGTGDVIEIAEASGPFKTRAEVCEVTKGRDGIRRLHVRFLGAHPPTHLIHTR